MTIGSQEGALVAGALLALLLLVAPLVGIRRAVKRMARGERATVPVIAACCAIGLAALGGVLGVLVPLYAVMSGLLNALWLAAALSGNRGRARAAEQGE